MIRLLLLLLLLFSFHTLNAKSNIDTKIIATSGQIKSFDKKYTSVHKKVAKNAKAILIQEKRILKQQKKLDALTQELKDKETRYNTDQNELAELQSSKHTLLKKQDKVEKALIDLIARSISISLLIDDQSTVTPEALITEEILKEISIQTKKEINTFNSSYSEIHTYINTLRKRTKVLQTDIAKIDSKRKEMLATKKTHEKALVKLNYDKKNYNKELQKVLNRKSALKKTLSRLNIIKEDEKQKARAKKEAEYQKKMLTSKSLPKVKSRDSSYNKIKTKRYRGKKTIAPLDHYSVVKKFGTYIDPIYNIRIYNESISLKPNTANAKVKTVLNGTVILAKNTPLLENVVIIEHTNSLHTIYAHLDIIAPGIKKGKRIKKGAVIGRVSDELMFEVTQKNYHINPLQLIK